MALVDAITNCPDTLEDRMVIREEFSRRELNQLIVVGPFSDGFSFNAISSRFCDISNPPDLLLIQTNLYTEEIFEDEDDIFFQKQSGYPTDPVPNLNWLVLLAKQHDSCHGRYFEALWSDPDCSRISMV
jgi:hypothetical protein